MNTPAHLVTGLAAFGRPGRPALIVAALAGSLIPDASLYALAGWELLVRGTSPDIVFRELYFSDGWQAVFAVDNSIPLWSAVLACALILRWAPLVAGSGAALLHLATDFLLHNDDARRHLWPVTDWVFVSPVSYWDGDHFGRIVGPVETALVLALVIFIWRRFAETWVRLVALVLGVLQLAPTIVWALMF